MSFCAYQALVELELLVWGLSPDLDGLVTRSSHDPKRTCDHSSHLNVYHET